MRQIDISTKKYPNTFTLVDDDLFDYLSQWKWRRNTFGHVVRGNGSKIMMHRVVNLTPDGLFTDHIDRNPLNNQRVNLRSCTNAQNQWNTPHTGVGWHKHNVRWRARIKVNGKNISLGYFKAKSDALEAYRIAKIKLHKEWVGAVDNNPK